MPHRVLSDLFVRSKREKNHYRINLRGGYAIEALQWLLDDGVAARIEVVSRRSGQDAAALDNDIYQRDGSVWNMRFDDYWRELNYG
ncbi:hypothetical protein E0D81_14635 [Lelliottia amnigena]|uniref:phage GP46 family protein n=1 Tax=Lelliottia amnigena TaxID=61646 RepID=UPI00103A4827|nr:phage GP46 family protein [Lelliottia amnigena]TCD17721.1 hypothetical protein E0D81_14635 [Lelliottia amnigena]